MYSSDTLSDIVSQIESDIALEMELDSLPEIGEERAIAFAVGAAKRDTHDHIEWLAKQIVPSAESDDQTIIDRAAYEGVPRKQASKASGTATISSSDGSDSGELDIGTSLQHDNGLLYTVTASESISEGVISFSIEAEESGSDGNLADEDWTLSLVSPVDSLESQATITSLSGGSDIESISELLGRLYFYKQNPPMGGAEHDYVSWATEVNEVTRAWAYDCYQGGSTVGLAFVCDNLTDIIPTDEKQEEVASYIDKHEDPSTGDYVGRPAGIELVMFKLSLNSVQLSIKLDPDNTETRENVMSQLSGLEQAYSSPGSTIKLSWVRTVIGNAEGVSDYECDLDADITSTDKQLISFAEPTWL